MSNSRTLEACSYTSKYIEVEGSKLHYIEAGEGDPILFLHGVPTSSYLWRNILPYLSPLGRCIAPDLIGFGYSDKPNIDYSIQDHIRYIEQFIKILNLKKIILVMHGWGSVIGFHYATHHRTNCTGLVFYEAFLRTLDYHDFSLPLGEQLTILAEQEGMEDMMRSGVSFIDKIIPQIAMQPLSVEAMKCYRQPFIQTGTARPIVRYLKELLERGNKSQVNQLIAAYSRKLTHSKLPKLMFYSVPGFITTIATVVWAKEHFSRIEIIDLGEELHLAQETCPQLMGEAISVWLQGISFKR
ncbi:MAG TPA: haloalkane dehalogenase [Gammaproteobacteria bacterium]|nr:haloalkane dehalogenase [Gammaproteobacteria bacterium]